MLKKSSSGRRKMIQFRNSDVHKEKKSIKAGINEGKTYLIFLFLVDLKYNGLFKIIIALNLGIEHMDKWCKWQQYDKGMEGKHRG